jgi:DNA-binding IclR family transcriptional regulator
VRRSPPTRRVVQVLDLLASRPGERFGNGQIAAELGLDASTCLGILNELTEAGYLVRYSDRSFGLGARLVGIGRAAKESQPSLAHAQAALRSLVAELGVGCTVSAVSGHEIVVLEAERPAGDRSSMLTPGARFPFVAPVGIMFAAWQPDDAVDSWLARAPVPLDAETVDRMRSVIESCRRTGALVQRLTDEEANLHRLLPMFFDQYQRDAVNVLFARSLSVYGRRDYLGSELDTDDGFPVSVICAPSFDHDGALELVVGAYVMRTAMSRDEIAAAVDAVRRAANEVTAAIGGRDPWT